MTAQELTTAARDLAVKEFSAAAEKLRERGQPADAEVADLLNALTPSLTFWAPYREHENGYRPWNAALALARAVNGSQPTDPDRSTT